MTIVDSRMHVFNWRVAIVNGPKTIVATGMQIQWNVMFILWHNR